jgi:hypothetical protein
MAERLPFGEIRPMARPIGAFINPANPQLAGVARPELLSSPKGINTVQQGSGGNVQGFNEFAQIADALGPFNRQLSQLMETGIKTYVSNKIDEGYYDELKNQQVRATLSLQDQQEVGAARAASMQTQLEKVDPPAAQLLRDSNPWRLIGRRRAAAQTAAGEIDNALFADLENNKGQLSVLQPGSPELMARKRMLAQQVYGKYGLEGDEPEAIKYVLPELNKAFDQYTEKHSRVFNETRQINTIALTTAALGQRLQGWAQKGISLANGEVVQLGDPRFAQLAGMGMTGELDKYLSMFGGKDKAEALKEIRTQLMGTFGQVAVLGDALTFVQGGNPGDAIRPTWGSSYGLEMLEIRNRGNAARQQTYELGQKAVEQTLDGLWWQDGSPGSMLPTDPRYAGALIEFRNRAAAAGYRDIDGYMKGRIDSQQAVVGQAYRPDPLASEDFMAQIDDLPRSAFSSPQAVQALREQARQAARAEPTPELQAAKYKEYMDTIKSKQKQATETTPGLQQAIDKALLQDLALPQVKPLVDASKKKGGGDAFSLALSGGAGTLAAASGLGNAKVTAFSQRVNNLMLRNAEAKIDQWMAERPGVPLSSSARNVLISEAIAETRKSEEYKAAFQTLTGQVPGQVGQGKVGTGPSQGTAPGPENRGVPRTAAAALPDSTAKAFQARPVMDGGWLHSELSAINNGKPASAELYRLAKRAGTTVYRYLGEQLRFYPQLDPNGEVRQYLEQEMRKQRQGQTVSSANIDGVLKSDASGGGGFNPMAPGSWLMNMLMPPAVAATIPTTTGGYGGYGGSSTRRPQVILGDKGGLAAAVSAGEGGWNSINYGTTGSASQMALTSMTIGQVEALQKRGRVFAVGAYQFTPGVLTRARKDAGLPADAPMTPENQTKMFWGLALGGKRERLAAYLRGESNDLSGAHQDLSMEWAGVKGPNGRGYYDGDKAGNKASVDAERVRQALIAARKQLSGR